MKGTGFTAWKHLPCGCPEQAPPPSYGRMQPFPQKAISVLSLLWQFARGLFQKRPVSGYVGSGRKMVKMDLLPTELGLIYPEDMPETKKPCGWLGVSFSKLPALF